MDRRTNENPAKTASPGFLLGASAGERARCVGEAAVGQLRRPVETGAGRFGRGCGAIGVQCVRHRDERERIVERVERGAGMHGRTDAIRRRRARRVLRDSRAGGESRRGRCVHACRCRAPVVRPMRRWRRCGSDALSLRCRVDVSRCWMNSRNACDGRRCGRRRNRSRRDGRRRRDVRRGGGHRGGLNGMFRRDVSDLHRRRETRERLVRGDQPADDAECADAPAGGVPRTPVLRATGGVLEGLADRAGRNGRCAGGHRPRCGRRLPVARAMRRFDVDA